MRSLAILALLTAPLLADEGHPHPDVHTPFGFKLTSERQLDGLSFVIRENGHAIVFAPAGSWFSKDIGELGSSIAWRWKAGAPGPFQQGNCLYNSPFGNSLCESDIYALEDGIYDDPNDPLRGRSFNHVELPGHITDLSALLDTTNFVENLWIGGTTESLKRTPEGIKIVVDDEFNVGTGPWLILEGVAIPEPSAALLFILGIVLSLRGRRKWNAATPTMYATTP